ncbi:MAG TPA: hypothetical protein VKR06_34770 [Ktedonosporobacter sp.]|nr:hypothetical protein [Ktedonosporobacter sp.]
MNKSRHPMTSFEVRNRTTLLSQHLAALTQARDVLLAKISAEKAEVAVMSQRSEEAHRSALQAKEKALREMQEQEPATDSRDARKRKLHSTPVEQQAKAIKGNGFLSFFVCLASPSYARTKTIQIRHLRQQARREWNNQMLDLYREIKGLRENLESPGYTSRQRTLLAALAADERELTRLEMQVSGKKADIESYEDLLALALAHDEARAKEQQEEEAARRTITQAQIDEAIARKAAAELMRDTLLTQAARASGQKQAREEDMSQRLSSRKRSPRKQ